LTRPAVDYREPAEVERRELKRLFEQRKLEPCSCGHPYGTPPARTSLHPLPDAAGRPSPTRPPLVEIICNRISDARAHGWLGEVEGLQHSLNAGRCKLAALERAPPQTAAPPRSLISACESPGRPGK
jgi:hypothetical protein